MPVRIQLSVATSDVSCTLSDVIWTYTFADASSLVASFARSLAGCCAHIRTVLV